MLIAVVLLGPLTTIGMAWASAAWAPLENEPGTVAWDGDHLQPWLIRLERVSATRVIWFEKGRIWGKPRGMRQPSRTLLQGKTIAVNCWVFAIHTRNNTDYQRGEVVIPESVQDLIDQDKPQACWGVARDARGWPLPALSALIIGTLDPSAATPLVCQHGILFDLPQGQQANLATVHALPLRPIWVGLIADSVFFAGSWWVALAALGLVKKRLATRAGRCPRCRYDLQGELDRGCPECGWNR